MRPRTRIVRTWAFQVFQRPADAGRLNRTVRLVGNEMSGIEHQGAFTTRPLVTIGIPTRNRSALLKVCVASALAQTYPNIEVVVSDNASTDDTLATLQEFADPRLRVVANRENVGHVGNFNRCLNEARGEYFVLLCDDNVIQPEFLEKCIRLVEKQP